MATLESDKVEKTLMSKMRAERKDGIDWRYIIYNDQGKQISVTRISKGAKHTLGPKRVSLIAHQLGFATQKQFIDLVSCTLSREEASKIIEANS
jgi:hypothetical protein